MNSKNDKFSLVLVTKSWNGKLSMRVKSTHATRSAAESAERKAFKFFIDHNMDLPDYRVLGPIQLKKLQEQVAQVKKFRRAEAVKKTQKTRKERGSKPTFIKCPHCGAKSKKLYSEMGGLQTRRCQNGHHFEHDKWIEDHAFWMFFG
jgi:hypothetical protein